jgi:hypothetical protein
MSFGHRLYFDVPYDSEKEQRHETACSGGGGVVFCEVVTESLNIIYMGSVLQRSRILDKRTELSLPGDPCIRGTLLLGD